MARTEYDVIVIGLGSGGGTMVNRLVRAGWRVLGLEAGIDMPTPADRRKQSTQLTIDEELFADWHFFAESEMTGYGFRVPQNDQSMGRMVGGSSHHFGMVCYRGTTEDYDEWDHLLRNGRGGLTGMLIFDGTTTVRGAGTRFDRDLAAGDYIRLDSNGQPYRVVAVRSDSELTIDDPQRLGIPVGTGPGTKLTPWNRASILQAYRAVERDIDFGSDLTIHSDSGDQHIGRIGGVQPGVFGDVRPHVRTPRILPIALDAMDSLTASTARAGLPFAYVDDRNSWGPRPNNAFFKIPLNYIGFDSEGNPVAGGQQTAAFTHLNKYDERRSTLIELVDPIRAHPNFTLIPEATVNRLLIERTGSGLQVTGVEYLRRRRSVTSGTGRSGPADVAVARASNVILAAGPYGTPAILLRSGVGASDRLAPHGIVQIHDLPGVGANVLQHTSSGIVFRTNVDLPNLFQGLVFGGTFRSSRNLAGAGFEVGDPPTLFDADPDCVYFLSAGRSELSTAGIDRFGFGLASKRRVRATYKRTFSLSAGVYKPRSRGDGVRLRSLDPEDVPIIRQGLFQDPRSRDAEAALEALQAAAAALLDPSQPFFREWVDPTVPVIVPETVQQIHATAGGAFHAVSTCAMGPDGDPMAVCDDRGRVRGIRGLRICDNSIMPTAVRANPHLPTCAHSHLIAEIILADGGA